MSKFEPKDMTGTLFKNDKREKDTHPHATGSAIINGVEYWVSAWTKEGKKGRFQSLAFKVKEERAREIRREAASNSYGREPNDYDQDSDLPF